MVNDERVEAARKALDTHLMHHTNVVCVGCDWDAMTAEDPSFLNHQARAALAAAGLPALEAENARLRWQVEYLTEEVETQRRAFRAWQDEGREDMQTALDERDAARRELSDLRAGVEALADEAGSSLPWQIEGDLRALLAAAPSEP